MYSISGNRGQLAYGITHFIADTIDDMYKISTNGLTPGSTVFVINTSNKYMLNNQKEWIKIANGSGGGGGDTPNPSDTYIYEGGELL